MARFAQPIAQGGGEKEVIKPDRKAIRLGIGEANEIEEVEAK